MGQGSGGEWQRGWTVVQYSTSLLLRERRKCGDVVGGGVRSKWEGEGEERGEAPLVREHVVVSRVVLDQGRGLRLSAVHPASQDSYTRLVCVAVQKQ